jgi:poly-gamma-glutamate capsule biosynthesis protein CapA/YwtB (metallophosphatase superfamily)
MIPYLFFSTLLIAAQLWGVKIPLPNVKPQAVHLPLTSMPAAKPVTMIAVGDINLGRRTGQEILKGNVDFPFANIADTLSGADITFGNLESQIRNTGGVTQDPNNEYRFSGPVEGAASLKHAGFDIVSTANNHMWDYGLDGLTQTLGALDQAGISHVGATLDPASNPTALFKEVNGQKFGFIAVTDLLNGYDAKASPYVTMASNPKVLDLIRETRPKVDWLIVSMHAGIEYQSHESTRQEELAHSFVDAGADFVIGHHPHVRQPLEAYHGKLIIYSLGNFAFWQPFSNETKTGSLLRITFNSDKKTLSYNLFAIAAGWQPSMSPELNTSAPFGGIGSEGQKVTTP